MTRRIILLFISIAMPVLRHMNPHIASFDDTLTKNYTTQRLEHQACP